MLYLNINILEGFSSKFSLLNLFQSLTHCLFLDLFVLLHDALLLPLFGLLAQTLFLGLANLLHLSLPLLQFLLLTLNIQAFQTLLTLFNGLSTSQDALVIFAGIFEIGSDGLLVMLITLLLKKAKNITLQFRVNKRKKTSLRTHDDSYACLHVNVRTELILVTDQMSVIFDVKTHQDGDGLDDVDGFSQRCRHGSQLVPYLL